MRRGGIGLVVAALALLPATPADAARFKRCAQEPDSVFGAQCGMVRVPLDRSRGVPGSIDLKVQRVRARRPSGTAVLALMGGPGSAATASSLDVAALFEPLLTGRDLIVFDQRGTGGSGALRCPSVEKGNLSAAAVAACGARLGPSGAFYTSRDTVADIEAVRRAAGVRKLAIYAVSYGTKVAQQYALAHPGRVDRLILDSPVPVVGSDPFDRSSIAAIPRVLTDACAEDCHPAIGDPADHLAPVLERARAGTLTADRYDGRGRARRTSVAEGEIRDALAETDFDPVARTTIPAALQAAAAGDAAPLERLVRRLNDSPPLPPRFFSTGLEVATLCEEAPLPWERSTPPAERRAAAQRALEAQPPEDFAPWSRSLAGERWPVEGCAGWPTSARRPADLSGPAPDVPVLVLAGEHDVRTPLSDAERIAASYPAGQLVVVPGVGHSVFFQDNDWFEPQYGCSYRAVRRFFLRGRGVACRASEDQALRAAAPFPASPDAYEPLGAPGARGRTVAAAMATLQDALDARDHDDRGGGLRGGYLRVGRGGNMTLRNYSFVPGVAVTGRSNFLYDGVRVRVTGAAAQAGTLTLAGGVVRGRIGGRTVRAEFDPVFDEVLQVGQPPAAKATAWSRVSARCRIDSSPFSSSERRRRGGSHSTTTRSSRRRPCSDAATRAATIDESR